MLQQDREATFVFVNIILLVLSVLSSVCGQLFLKLGANKLAPLLQEISLGTALQAIQIPELILGLGCYGLGTIVYILLLSRVPLSVAGPSLSLVYVFSVLLGYFVFKEAIPTGRMIGLGLIITGVILVMSQK